MTPRDICDKLTVQFGSAITEVKIEGVLQPFVKTRVDSIREVCLYLRDNADLGFDYLMCLSGVDYGKGIIGAVYHLSSTVKKHAITLKVEVPADRPEVPSVADIWESANWHEREAYDLMGLRFIGHPDLRRILLPEDWPGHPLRKDFKVPEFYRGMKVPY